MSIKEIWAMILASVCLISCISFLIWICAVSINDEREFKRLRNDELRARIRFFELYTKDYEQE